VAKEAKATASSASPKGKAPEDADIDLRDFLAKASAPELLDLARQTALAAHPLVKEYDNAQEQALRKLIHLEQKKHADFRNRLATLLRQKLPQG
jgi:hypothetical protein